MGSRTRRTTGAILAFGLAAGLISCGVKSDSRTVASSLHLIDVSAKIAVTHILNSQNLRDRHPLLLRTKANEYGAAVADFFDTHAFAYTDIVLSTGEDFKSVYRLLERHDVPEGFTGPLIIDDNNETIVGARDAQSYLQQLCLGDVEGNPDDLVSFAKTRYGLESTLERVDSLDVARFLDKEGRTVYTAILQPGLTEYQKHETTHRLAKQYGLLDTVIVYDIPDACSIPELKKLYTMTDDLETIAHEVVHALLRTPLNVPARTRNLLEKTEEAYAVALATPLLNEYVRERRSPPFPQREDVSDDVRHFLPGPNAEEVLRTSALKPFDYSLQTAQAHLDSISRQ